MIPIVQTDRALPLVQLSITALSGTVFDPPGKEGLLRLTTRLMRRTAHGWSANAVDERLDAMGGSVGAEANLSGLGLGGSVLRRSLDRYVEVLAGGLAAPGFDADEFEKLKRETLAEIVEYQDDDRSLARIWFRKTFFRGHPYGRSVVGTPTSIRSLTLDDVHWAYQEIFKRAAYSGAFAGDIDESEARAIMEAVCPSRRTERDENEKLDAPTGPRGLQLLLVNKPERTQTQILIGCLGTHPGDADHAALGVANTVFGGTFTARLTQEVRGARGWSYGAYSYLPIERQRQAFTMWTFPAATDAAACLELELAMLGDWIENGITQEELDYAKHYLVRSHVFSGDTAAKRIALAHDEVVLGLPPRYYDDYPAAVERVTLEQANAAITKRISNQNALIVVLGTESEIGKALRAKLPEGTQVSVVAHDAQE